MPTPSTRTPVRIARGSYSNLNGSVSDLQDGEISYAEDQDKLYIKEGGSLVALTSPTVNPVFTGNATFDTNTLYVDGTNNRVGIGTTSPIETIQATGAIVSSGSNNTSSTAGANRSIIDFTSGGTRIGHFRGTTSAGSGSVKFFVDSSEKMQLDSSGRLLIGVTSSSSVYGLHHQLQVEGTNGATSSTSLTRNSNDANPPYLTFGKTRGTSDGSNTIVQDGDALGTISFNGADGTNKDHMAAQITGAIDGTPGENDLPGRIVFKTTADGANSSTERMRIDKEGRCIVGGGSHAGGSALVVKGGNQNTYSTAGFFSSATNPAGDTDLAQLRFGANASAIGATIRVKTDGQWGSSDYPTKMLFQTTADGSGSRTTALTLDSSQNATFAGTVSDSKGDLRTIVQTSKSSAHTIVASDSGKHSINSSGGWTFNTSTGFTAGQAITLINNSGSNQTVTNTGCTMYLAGDTSAKSSLTLKGRGMATFICTASNVYYGSGAGLE